jgi:hypothetical protein
VAQLRGVRDARPRRSLRLGSERRCCARSLIRGGRRFAGVRPIVRRSGASTPPMACRRPSGHAHFGMCSGLDRKELQPADGLADRLRVFQRSIVLGVPARLEALLATVRADTLRCPGRAAGARPSALARASRRASINRSLWPLTGRRAVARGPLAWGWRNDQVASR